MGATPNFDAGNVSSDTYSGTAGTGGNSGFADDVSFNRGGTTDGTTGNTQDGMGQRTWGPGGTNRAQDAISQLQSKASELTARLVDNINVDDLTQRLEQQVREHPSRTLLLAVGAGFLLGRSTSGHR